MLEAHRYMAVKIAQKFKKDSKSTSLAVLEKIFDKKQGFFSKIKQKYQGYISSDMIIKMYKKAIKIELHERYQKELEEGRNLSEQKISKIYEGALYETYKKRENKVLLHNNKQEQNLITPSKNEETNIEQLSNDTSSSELKNDGRFQKFFTDKENERLNQLITQQK
jgi:hypothetical protein